ncbi:MAG TPA: M3 family oligoendopeptidase [Cytophagaceae bacterium]|nr:M3 family oligoendopeptidase [Cytophagaceae bacterium]
MQTLEIPKKNNRHFLSQTFVVDKWENIKPLYEELKSRGINSVEELKKWFVDRSELESVISEDMGWRYIKMTGDTANKEYVDRFNYFVSEIQPHIEPYSNDLNEKALKNQYLQGLHGDGYDIMIRSMKKEHEIFREKNIPLNTEISQEAQKFGAISGAMMVETDGKELTLQQAADLLQSTDRKVRENAYYKIAERRYQDKDKLDELFNKLLALRHQVALNADFKNFRDYMFAALGRFDYKAEDCFAFHDAVEKEVVPMLNKLARERKEALKVEQLKPWDLAVNYLGDKPLKPFQSGEELINKSIECFSMLNPFLGERLSIMKKMGHLDLESRKGKAPGGYNYPLDETGVPFIFMNATSSLRDLVTMVHEGGHAVHSFVTRDLELSAFKHTTAEVAELASMSMELISMEHWDLFFTDKQDLIRAKREHLEGIISTLPWVSTVDKFQHWIYENPTHTIAQRTDEWNRIFAQFGNNVTDWKGLEKFKNYVWQKQLHIYEVPFYYIEYAIAQLGAIPVWKNFKEDQGKGLDQYLAALKLGYTKPIREIYKTAGIKFDFSQAYIHELMGFVEEELAKCRI